VVVWYVIAKVLEREDWQIYGMGGRVSGHRLKHLAAGVSTLYLVRLFRVNMWAWPRPNFEFEINHRIFNRHIPFLEKYPDNFLK
jgi:hypothetical protein